MVEHYSVVAAQINSLRPALAHYLEVAERHDCMEKLLTDPNLLADWTLKMLGEGGIYGQPSGMSQDGMNGMRQIGRASFPSIPAPQGGVGDYSQRWQMLEQVLDTDPTQAWRVLDQFAPADFQSRQLVAL